MPYLSKVDQAAAAAKHYQANKSKIVQRSKTAKRNQKQRIRETILSYLENRSCIICDEKDPIVLEFDHRVHSEKKFSIGEAASKAVTLKALAEEMEKCDVLCANCHRRKTYKERGHTHKD